MPSNLDPSTRRPFVQRFTYAGALLALAATGTGALAQSVTIKNDSLVNGSTAAIQLGFVNNEIGCTTFWPNGTPGLTSSMFPLKIKRVQIFWKSFFGGASNPVQESINIYRGWINPPPNLIFESDPPQMIEGVLNEFNFENENIIITSPEPFSVCLKFADAPSGDGGGFDINKASLVTDTNGCQTIFNMIFAIPGGWTSLCGFGVSGDLVIRAVVEPVPQPTCEYDYNQDENVDLTDAQQLAQVAAGVIFPESNWLSGDVNGDENADLTDAQILAAYIATGQCSL
jgi:hypothetical protein